MGGAHRGPGDKREDTMSPAKPTDEELRKREQAARVVAQQQADNDGKLREELETSLGIAAGVRAPVKVKALVHQQAGQECLIARCPRCSTLAGLSGEGKHLCRGCYHWLEYCREE